MKGEGGGRGIGKGMELGTEKNWERNGMERKHIFRDIFI